MKELWIKKIAWQRHLIENESIDEVKAIIKFLDQNNLEIVIDFYDKNPKEEFDNILLFPGGMNRVEWHPYNHPLNSDTKSSGDLQ